MKKLVFLLMISFMTFAQEEPLHTGEAKIILINNGSSWNVTFVATAVTERWDENYYLTSDYESATVPVIGQQIVPPYIPTAYFDLVIDVIAAENPVLALGKYKISAVEGDVEKAYFYMDWRTSDYGESPDVIFIYDYSTKHFRNEANTNIIDGTNQTVWDLVSGIDHVTSGLELYLNYSNQSGSPLLSWNTYHSSSILGYNIYRKITLDGGSSQTDIIFTTSTSYLDDDFVINSRFGEDQVEYWIKAKISSTQESLNGNHIQLIGDSYIQWKLISQDLKYNFDYKLSQNYPNPFNPSTNISYQLKEGGFVNFTIYNSIGESISELVNQRQEQWNYSFEFNASNLPSGIYFYKIQTEKFTDVKKMILLR